MDMSNGREQLNLSRLPLTLTYLLEEDTKESEDGFEA